MGVISSWHRMARVKRVIRGGARSMINRIVILALLFLPTSIGAQQTAVQMPPLLIGSWHYVATFAGERIEPCGNLSNARGMTITAQGLIIDNDGSLTCTLGILKVFPAETATELG